MAYEFRTVQQVEFVETDMAGIVHFASFFRWMEVTEHAFFRSLGHSVHMKVADVTYGWPRVHAECDYKAPLKFEDRFEVQLLVAERREKSLSYRFIFRKLDDGPGVEVARGLLTVVCVRYDEAGGRMRAAAIPEPFASRIEVAPPELLSPPPPAPASRESPAG